jgi:hypothetical protein
MKELLTDARAIWEGNAELEGVARWGLASVSLEKKKKR